MLCLVGMDLYTRKSFLFCPRLNLEYAKLANKSTSIIERNYIAHMMFRNLWASCLVPQLDDLSESGNFKWKANDTHGLVEAVNYLTWIDYTFMQVPCLIPNLSFLNHHQMSHFLLALFVVWRWMFLLFSIFQKFSKFEFSFGWACSNSLKMKFNHCLFQSIDKNVMWINSNMNLVCCNFSFPFSSIDLT